MKAKIKVNYSDVKKGEIFEVAEIILNKIVVLNINGVNVDFGFSEVEIVSTNSTELFELGRYVIANQNEVDFTLRDKDIKKIVESVKLPISKSLCNKSIYYYLYDCN